MRRGWVAALLAACLLSGCSTAVAGHGRSSVPTSSPATTPSGSAGTSYPSALLRSPVSTVLGDPVTADVCALIDDNALARFGEVVEDHGVEYAGYCGREIDDNGSRVESLYLYFTSPADLQSTVGATKTTVSGVTVYQFPGTATCQRYVVATDVAARVSVVADTPSATVCEADDVVVAAVAARIAAHQALPRRAIAPSASLTQLDLCKVAAKAGLPASVPTLGQATAHHNGFGAECVYDNAHVSLYLDVAFRYLHGFDDATHLTVGGHTLYQRSETADCQVASLQQGTGDGEQELLYAEAFTSATERDANLCRDASGALAKMLDAAGLS